MNETEKEAAEHPLLLPQCCLLPHMMEKSSALSWTCCSICILPSHRNHSCCFITVLGCLFFHRALNVNPFHPPRFCSRDVPIRPRTKRTTRCNTKYPECTDSSSGLDYIIRNRFTFLQPESISVSWVWNCVVGLLPSRTIQTSSYNHQQIRFSISQHAAVAMRFLSTSKDWLARDEGCCKYKYSYCPELCCSSDFSLLFNQVIRQACFMAEYLQRHHSFVSLVCYNAQLKCTC